MRRLVATVLTILAVGLLVTAASSPLTAGSTSTVGPPDDSTVGGAATAATITSSETTDIGPATGSAAALAAPNETAASEPAIAGTLANTSGTQTVVVRLGDHQPGEFRTANHETPVAAMQANAAAAQSPLEQFVNGTTHVTVDKQFWLANAVVLTVDTTHVPLNRLTTIENVERIHTDYQVSVNTTTVHDVTGVQPESTPTTNQPTVGLSNTAPVNSLAMTAPTMDTSVTTQQTPRPTRALEAIGVPTVWEQYETRGEGVKVAVLDTGVNPKHPDINITQDNWVCYTDCQNGPHDVNGHGTHVSGTIVGGGNNAADLQIGAAPEATLMHAKVQDDTGQGSFSTIVSGMEWAVTNDADVISMSLGASGYNEELIEPVQNAQANGTIVAAASGNRGVGHTVSPGNVYNATAVGSINIEPRYPSSGGFGLTNNTVSDFSGGENITTDEFAEQTQLTTDWPEEYTVPTVVAPGNLIWSADNEIETATTCNGFEPVADLACSSGTSMATPHVSGTIALMQSATNQTLSPSEIKTTLETTATDIGANKTRQGTGRINATAAVEAVTTRSNSTAKPNITVSITDSPTRVTAGRELTIDYTATNVGSGAGNTTLTFRANETIIETIDTDILDPNESVTGTFSYRPAHNETKPLTIAISSDSDTTSRTITVVKPQVNIANVSITPTKATETTTTHMLNMAVLNVSDDGKLDTFTIEMPEKIDIVGNETVSAVDATGTQIPVSNTTVTTEDELTFEISPDTETIIRDMTVTAKFDARKSSQ
jgi:subtilisin family serine protease